jgi:carbamate kinase
MPQPRSGPPLPADGRPLAVVALGGNALLRRGEPLEAAAQARAAREAAEVLASVSETHRLVVTHGNGPQVGLLALMAEAYEDVAPYPLDVLDAETEGQIGYVVELELDNAIDHQDTVAVITRVEVDEADPAFAEPTKFIGLVYDEADARRLAAERGWTVRPDGDRWRRVVPSPEPRRIVQLAAIRRLVEGGFLVVCAGGGGVPVVPDGDGGHRGVEAVIDKDLCSSLLATGLGADLLVLATDVAAVFDAFGSPDQRAIAGATPAALRALDLPGGSMGPKVEAVCRFAERTGGRGAIGALAQIPELLAGTAGTQVRTDGPDLTHHEEDDRP